MEHFSKTLHFSSILILLILRLARAVPEDGRVVEVVPPVSLLCISECSTCPTICAPPPPPPPPIVLKSPPPVPHVPPLAYFPLNSPPPRPTSSPPPPWPSPPPPPATATAVSSHSPPPPAFRYYFNLPPPPPVLIPVPVPPSATAGPHGNTNSNAYNYYFYAPASSSAPPSLPTALFWGLFLFHLMLCSWWKVCILIFMHLWLMVLEYKFIRRKINVLVSRILGIVIF